MTELLEQAVATARALSPDMQDAMASLMLSFAEQDGGSLAPLSESEEASMANSLAQAQRGDFASDEEVAAILGER